MSIVLVFGLFAGGWAVFERIKAASLADDLAVESALLGIERDNNKALELQVDQMREAAQIAQAEAARERADRIMYEAILTEIEELNDETPISPAVAAALDRLRGRGAGDTDRVPSSRSGSVTLDPGAGTGPAGQ
ncbi:hypothetical protein [Pseudooceanicola nitratireducens]|uniref:hypothetical protein n=1 Tax=Pseudooceanicola nitratireducens TaxID=517719 RepID=UPI003C7D9F8C